MTGAKDSLCNALFSWASFGWYIHILIVLNYIVDFDGLILYKLLVVAFKLIARDIIVKAKEMKGTGELYAKPFQVI